MPDEGKSEVVVLIADADGARQPLIVELREGPGGRWVISWGRGRGRGIINTAAARSRESALCRAMGFPG